MTNNDTSTLNGALQELGETMAANLTQQGVTSSASEGLTTLAGKILDIQTGGGSCYKIEFSEDSYTAVGGSATLEIYLQENYQPKSGATVTVTGSDSSLYTGLTNSNGIAEVTVTGVSGTVTFTGSYSNVSAQCTVTGQTYLFYDSCASDNTSQYTNFYEIWDSTTVNASLSFDTDHYVLTNSKSSYATVCLPVTAGLDDWVLTAKIRAVSSSSDKGGGVAIAQDKEKGVGLFQPNSKTTKHLILYNPNMTGGYVASNVAVSNLTTNDYNTYELTKDGTSLTFKIYNASGTQVFSKVVTIQNSSYLTSAYPSISIAKSNSVYVKEIKLESL